MKSFDTAARRHAADGIENPEDIEFEVDGEVLTASAPSSGQLALFYSGSAKGGIESISAVLGFLRAVLPTEDYEYLEMKLEEGVEIDLLVDIVEFLIEGWSTRPTKPSAASARSRKSTGKSSTAKPRAKAGTTSRSRSTASAT